MIFDTWGRCDVWQHLSSSGTCYKCNNSDLKISVSSSCCMEVDLRKQHFASSFHLLIQISCCQTFYYNQRVKILSHVMLIFYMWPRYRIFTHYALCSGNLCTLCNMIWEFGARFGGYRFQALQKGKQIPKEGGH